MEGFVDLFVNEDTKGNRPHSRGFVKIDGRKMKYACWTTDKSRS